MNDNLLNKINSPDDLRALRDDEIPELASEIRAFLTSTVTKTGGHLASNLGAVELTLAIHRVFDSPRDHIIFDVGHQAYVHKLITGRREGFSSLRTPGGLSGFTKRCESEHDPFGAGHSSTSLSAALGFASADLINGSGAYTVAVIGDGAYTGGMIHEALNNCKKNMRLIIILNENEMSISKNIGGFAKHIARVRSNKSYYRVKDATRNTISRIPLVGKAAFALARDTKQTIKNIMYSSNYFEELGLYYMGPVNGNDYYAVEDMLRVAKGLERSVVIHVTTKKGKGYRPAEQNPGAFHSVRPAGSKSPAHGFSNMAGEYLADKAYSCRDICAITAAMTLGTGLTAFMTDHPSRFFDVGIAEEHAATFAAGLAANGMRPYFAVYSSFLQRAYDNLIHDVALQHLPVTFLIDRAGLSVGDGPTHHGIYDVAFLSQIPEITVYVPASYASLKKAIDLSYLSDRATAIRYSNCGEDQRIDLNFTREVRPGELGARCDFTEEEAPETVIVTYGRIVGEAMKAEKELKEKGRSCGIILLETIKPYGLSANDIGILMPAGCKNVVFLEEGVRNGGAAMILSVMLNESGALSGKRTAILAIENTFEAGEQGKTIFESCGISASDIVSFVTDKK
ncbi:MAG: 1-deoxy-D-xylulose-5-phosphate synthase [Clostridia bacterium]|nr:1-deoxy-D-xylulose-5-phosphate synthase [Clostridia bacterium]